MSSRRLSHMGVCVGLVAAAATVGMGPPGEQIVAAESVLPGGSLATVVPARLLETRSGPNNTTIDDQFNGIGQRPAGSVTKLDVTGRGGVPIGAGSVMLNVTAILPNAPGYLTVYPCGEDRPHTSNVNYQPGDVVPNAVLAKTGTNGQVCIYTLAAVDIIVDVNGYVPALGSLATVVPARLLETRSGPNDTTTDGSFEGVGRRTAGSITKLTVTGRGGVPLGAGSVMLNVTAVLPDAGGYLTVYPCGEDRPHTSNVNYQPGDVVPNAVLAKTGTNGQVCIYTLAAVDIIVDVNGYVPASGSFSTVVPARLLETRTGPNDTTSDGSFEGIGRRTAGSITKLTVTGRGGVPLGAGSVMLNVTAVLPDAAGYLTVYPCGDDRPHASNINYQRGDVVPNAVLAKTGTNGQVCIYTLAAVDIIVDVNGYRPPNVDVILDETARVSKSIGSDGGGLAGVVAGIPFNLSIPKGSLVSTQTITATPGLSISGTAFDHNLVSVLQFGPDGLRFSKPVTLTFEIPDGVNPADLIAFGYRGPGELVHLIPHTAVGSTVTIELWHFSGAGIATAKSAIGSIAVYTSAAGEVAAGQIGVYLDQVAAQILLGQEVTIDSDGIAELLKKWWDLGLAPTLAEAKQHPLTAFPGFEQNNAEMWIAEALNWEAVRQSLGIGPIGDIDVFSTAIDVANKAEAAANTKCVGGTDTAAAAQFAQVLDWQTMIQSLGGSGSASLADCAELIIKDDVIPEQIDVGNSGPGRFVIELQFKGPGGQPRRDLAFSPNVSAIGADLTDITGPADGLVTFTIEQKGGPTTITAAPTLNYGGWEFTTERSWSPLQDITIDLTATSTNIDPNASTQINVSLTDTNGGIANKTVTFAIVEGGGGSLDAADGLTANNGELTNTYHAPAEAGQTTITATYAPATGTVYSDTVSIVHGATVEITPAGALVDAGTTMEFTAATEGLTPAGVTWDSTCGTRQGMTNVATNWTAPNTAGTCTITAKSIANPNITATAVVNVELASGPGGTFAEGFYYGRKQHRCEFWYPENDHLGICPQVLNPQDWAWMYIHEDAGQTVIEFHTGSTPACAWPGRARFPGIGVIGNVADQTVFGHGIELGWSPIWPLTEEEWAQHRYQFCTWYPDDDYQARYETNQRFEVGSPGPLTVIPLQSLSWKWLCYQGCRESHPNSGEVKGAEVRFEADFVTWTRRPGTSNAERWIFAKGDERDPFGDWAFHPDSLETTPHPDRVDP